MVTEASLIVDYILSVLQEIIMFSSLKVCEWLYQSHAQKWAWLCLEPPLLIFLEITTAYNSMQL